MINITFKLSMKKAKNKEPHDLHTCNTIRTNLAEGRWAEGLEYRILL